MSGIIILILIALLVRKVIQRRKEEKIFQEYMAKMDQLRKQKKEAEAAKKEEIKKQQPIPSEKAEISVHQQEPITRNPDIHYYENGFDKGEIGEWAIEYALKNALPNDIYILRNLYIPYLDIVSEIDLVLLHETGIYVFESKNYSGWIFGKKSDEFWTECFPNGKKIKFYNPIRQNKTHINAIAEQLKLPSNHRPKSYVVFSEHCELKAVPKSDKNTVICQLQDLIPIIERRIEETGEIYGRAVLSYMNSYLHQFEKY